MSYENYYYIIIGAGLAGISAAKAIRELDKKSSVLLVGRECHPPYDRPPLSKDLWFEDKKAEEIFVEPLSFYLDNHIELKLGTVIHQIDADKKPSLTRSGGSSGSRSSSSRPAVRLGASGFRAGAIRACAISGTSMTSRG